MTNEHELADARASDKRDDRWWYRVYIAVLVFAVIVILSLWSFSRYFSA